MKKRMISCILSLALVFSLVPAAFAASDEANQAAQSLYELGLFNGTGTDANGKPVFDLDRAPTRHEAVTMLVRLLGKEQEAKQGSWTTPFTDVAEWAKPYVGYAYTNGLTAGTSATTYDGDDIVTASQYITFVLRALGYESETDFQWNKAWELSDQIGLTAGEYDANTTSFARGDVAVISSKTLYCVLKGTGKTLLESLNEPVQTETYSPIETKIEILEIYKSGLGAEKSGMEYMIGEINALSSNQSYAYKVSRIATAFRYEQLYLKKAVGYWEDAVALCGDYSDTQMMKQYLTQLIVLYSDVLSYEITTDNVVDYMTNVRFPENSTEIKNNIQSIVDEWVVAAIN